MQAYQAATELATEQKVCEVSTVHARETDIGAMALAIKGVDGRTSSICTRMTGR